MRERGGGGERERGVSVGLSFQILWHPTGVGVQSRLAQS